MQAIRYHGRWEEWLEFFLEGVIEVADGATETTRRIVAMIEQDRAKLQTLGRAAASVLSLHEYAIRHVLLRAPVAANALGVTEPTIYNAIRNLTEAGILREITGRTWGRVHIYDDYLMILNEGTEVEPSKGSRRPPRDPRAVVTLGRVPPTRPDALRHPRQIPTTGPFPA